MGGQRQAGLPHREGGRGVAVGAVWPRYHICLGDRGFGARGLGPQSREAEARELKLSCCGSHSQREGSPWKVGDGRFDEISEKEGGLPQRTSQTDKVENDGSPEPDSRPAPSLFPRRSRKSPIDPVTGARDPGGKPDPVRPWRSRKEIVSRRRDYDLPEYYQSLFT